MKVVVKVCLVSVLFLLGSQLAAQPVRIGSKPFNENYILAEIMAQLLESRGFEVERKFGLGGTLISFEALRNGEIDVYPEYSGTITQAILKLQERKSFEELETLLATDFNLRLLPSFGFNNTYAMAARKELAKKRSIKKISELQNHADLRFGLSYEFMQRGDGWPALSSFYNLKTPAVGMEHALCYPAIVQGEIDLMDVYSTDAEIRKYDLFLLEDDKGFFPTYLAAPFVHAGINENALKIINELTGKIDAEQMQQLNALVAIEGKTFAFAADQFLRENGFIEQTAAAPEDIRWQQLADRTGTHLKLTAIALVGAIILAIPLGVLTYRMPRISTPVIYSAGLMQTIPSLALLAFMIAPFGTGNKPALIALTLYALLPILRNTYTALHSIDPLLKKVSVGMGLTAIQRLRHIELPLAMPTILAGIRTAAVITIGTATLAAFIGAGGLGEYIQTGLALNDPETTVDQASKLSF